MKYFSKSILLSLTILLSTPLIAVAEPSEETLVRAWEKTIRSDPNTKELKKISDNVYQVKTTSIPFDGKVKITDVSVAENVDEDGNGTSGKIEIEFVGVTKEFTQNNARKLAQWQRNNYFVYAREQDDWILSAEYLKKLSSQRLKENEKKLIWSQISLYLPLIAFLIFSFFIINSTKKSTQKAMSVNEDNNRVLKEILLILKENQNRST